MRSIENLEIQYAEKFRVSLRAFIPDRQRQDIVARSHQLQQGVQDKQGYRGEYEEVFGTKNVIICPSMSSMKNVDSDSITY